MAFTWNLQYRLKGASGWTTGVTGVTKTNGELLAETTGLTMGQTYEFRWQRVNNGSVEAHSNVVEAFLDPNVNSNSNDLSKNGSQIAAAGTFTLTTGGATFTFVRSSSKLVIQLTANWDWVSIDLNSALNGTRFYYVQKTGTSYPNSLSAGYTADTTVIAKTSQKTIDIKLDKSYTYSLNIKFGGKSSGTIAVNAY